uniref:Homeobox domain-containing protein n=1 Tax=Parastrongyloides trichosuri TaxID=131310 RepID=A0A0N4ZXY2_PARTI
MRLFTVEQLELIRRLRLTGISADAVLEAFKTLEQFENNLESNRLQQAAIAAMMMPGSDLSINFNKIPLQNNINGGILSSGNILSNTNNQSNFDTLSQNPLLFKHLTVAGGSSSNISSSSNNNANNNNNNSNSSRNSTFSDTSPSLILETNNSSPSLTTSTTTTTLKNNNNDDINNSTILKTTEEYPFSTTPPTSNGGRPIRSNRTPMREITTLDDPKELEEFIEKGEENCINDMRQFITQLSLRQTTVAQMTGVSQPYISKMLNGNHKELSLRCRKNIYSWYLNMRRHPEKLSSYLSDPLIRLETNNDGELIPQRRERYVFRPILIKILEKFFLEAPFPDFSKRMEIASVCNKALMKEKSVNELMSKEIVSPQVVANWFANKRKEMKRKCTDDGSIIYTSSSGIKNTLDLYRMSSPEYTIKSSGSTTTEDSRPSSTGGEENNSPINLLIKNSNNTNDFSILMANALQQQAVFHNVFNNNNSITNGLINTTE